MPIKVCHYSACSNSTVFKVSPRRPVSTRPLSRGDRRGRLPGSVFGWRTVARGGTERQPDCARLDDKAAAASVFYSTAPGDAKGGRYVANLVSLEIRAPSAAPDAEALQQGVVQISGALEKPLTLDAAALQAEPQTVLQLGSLDYGGVSLWTLLAEAGLKPDTSLKNLQCCRCSGWRKAMTAIG